MSTVTSKELKERLSALERQASIAESTYTGLYRDMKYEAERKINLFIAGSDELCALRTARKLVEDMRAALKAAQDEEALQVKGRWNVGTKMVLWLRRQNGYGEKAVYNWVATEETGVVEVVTSQTVHPGNMGTYSRARVGSFIIRMTNKHGNPMKTYVGVSSAESEKDWESKLWRPVGVNLNEEKNGARLAQERAAAQAKQMDAEKFAADALAAFYPTEVK